MDKDIFPGGKPNPRLIYAGYIFALGLSYVAVKTLRLNVTPGINPETGAALYMPFVYAAIITAALGFWIPKLIEKFLEKEKNNRNEMYPEKRIDSNTLYTCIMVKGSSFFGVSLYGAMLGLVGVEWNRVLYFYAAALLLLAVTFPGNPD